MQSNSKIRNIEIPENLFSNLGEIKKTKKNKSHNENLQNDSGIEMTNYSNHKEYRERISKMYNSIENLTPIDGEIDNILYFNNYIEKGIVVKPKVSSLKQFWTEYRLITNEKKLPKYQKKIEEKEDNNIEKIDMSNNEKEQIQKKTIKDNYIEINTTEKLNNFDELFEALSQRVKEINSYIDELKEIRISIDESNNKLEEDKEKFKEEKQEFLEFKQEEEKKIEKDKETLKVNFDRLQTIIDDLDKKLNEIDK